MCSEPWPCSAQVNSYSLLNFLLCNCSPPNHLSGSDPNGWSSEGYSLSSSSTESTTKQDSDRREEMRKARERQQKIADERTKEAAILRKEKEAKERKRKNQAALKKYPGDRLGDGRPTNNTSRSTSSSSSRLRSNDYNPMQPWNSGTSSYRYVLSAIFVIHIPQSRWKEKKIHSTIAFFVSSFPFRPSRRARPGGGS